MAAQNESNASPESTPDYVVTGGDFDNDFSGDFEQGGDTAPGMGQSKSSRRRRRKRKNKGGSAGSGDGASSADGQEAAPSPIVMEGESIALAASAPATASAPQPRRQQQSGGQQGGSQQQAGGPGHSKRWKKKNRERERRARTTGDNPGNDFRADQQPQSGFAAQVYGQNGNYGNGNFNGGFKRKNKGGGGQQQRKERGGGFVGPMDHSYREVNGNYEAASPSTIQLHGHAFGRKHRQHHGDSQPIDHNMPRAIPIPENAQTHIYFFIEDLFFTAKIQESARKLGVKVAFLKSDKEALDQLTSGEDTDKPALIVFDLNNANAKPLTTIPKLRAKLKKTVSIIGFLSHLQGDLKAKAVEVGCDVVMPRAAFSQGLPNLLRRYSVEEEEEINYNQ